MNDGAKIKEMKAEMGERVSWGGVDGDRDVTSVAQWRHRGNSPTECDTQPDTASENSEDEEIGAKRDDGLFSLSNGKTEDVKDIIEHNASNENEELEEEEKSTETGVGTQCERGERTRRWAIRFKICAVEESGFAPRDARPPNHPRRAFPQTNQYRMGCKTRFGGASASSAFLGVRSRGGCRRIRNVL